MWPFSNTREEMLRRELEQSRTYLRTHTGVDIRTHNGVVRSLEDRLTETRNSLAIVTAKHDVLAMRVEMQRREIDSLQAKLVEASKNDSPKDAKTGKFTKKATNV